MGVRVEALTRRIGDLTILDRVSFEGKSGEIVAILGPSGSGKSTLLRAIAGLDPPDGGDVFLFGERATHVPVQKRNIGFVFQGYALFKHRTVRDNIAFGLEVRRTPAAKIKPIVDDMLALVELRGFGDRFPSELSGGQRQRVALARALAPGPKLLLLDEPFGALDAKVRLALREQLRKLAADRGITMVFVTHDQEEAMDLADRVVVLAKGRVEQVGTPHEIYDHPATELVARFVGATSVLRGEVRDGRAALGDLVVHAPPGTDEGKPIHAVVRPHDVDLSVGSPASAVASGRVERMNRVGWVVKIQLRLSDGQPLAVELTKDRVAELGIAEGDWVMVNLREAKIFVQDYAI